MKRYYLQHAESRRRVVVDAPDFHSACQRAGWFVSDTVLLGVQPTDTPEADFRVEVIHTLRCDTIDALLTDGYAQSD